MLLAFLAVIAPWYVANQIQTGRWLATRNLQNIFVETFGTNDALWSLTNEFFYYVMCGVFLYALSKNRRPLQRLCLLALLGGISWLLFPKILLFGTLWLLGMALRVLPLRRTLPIAVSAAARNSRPPVPTSGSRAISTGILRRSTSSTM